jgi:hypothetical protein
VAKGIVGYEIVFMRVLSTEDRLRATESSASRVGQRATALEVSGNCASVRLV